jgi:hypothetical protein
MEDLQTTPSSNASATTGMVIAEGIIQNLPEIICAVKDIYAIRMKESAFRAALEGRCIELNINSNNFIALVQCLTDLSKQPNADEATKAMYRDMIKTLFEIFAARMRSATDFASFLES